MTKPVNYSQQGKLKRKRIYDYVRGLNDEWVSVKQVAKDLDITQAVAYHYVSRMVQEGYFQQKKEPIGRIVNVFIKPSVLTMPQEFEEVIEVLDDIPPVPPTPPHIRVVRLLDNPLPRPEEPKKRTKVYVGSGMDLFNKY